MNNALSLQQLPTDIQADGILYFLPGGHFLWRYKDKAIWESKFVTIDDVAYSFANIDNDTGWLPEGVIRAGRSQRGEWFVYAAPPQKRDIILLGESITVPIPATVLIGVGHAYYLFAVKEFAVTPKSALFAAPFSNVYGNARICWGNNHRPPAHHSRAQQVWELFFSTPFNRDLATNKSASDPKDITEKLRSLAGKKNYPLNDLLPENTSLDNQLSKVMKREWSD